MCYNKLATTVFMRFPRSVLYAFLAFTKNFGNFVKKPCFDETSGI